MKFDNKAALWEMLERMETQELDTMLQEELRSKNPNGELIRHISSILKKRDQDMMPEVDANVQQAWEQYQRKTAMIHKKPKIWNSFLVKAASLVLVIITLVAFLPQRAEAANIFERFVAWTEEVFSFINPADEAAPGEEYIFLTDQPGLQEVYEKVVELGVTVPVVPGWLPEGYELLECALVETPTKKMVTAVFANGNAAAVYELNVYADNTTSSYYKDGEVIRETEKYGITHTILRNADLLVATWTIDNIECFVSIDCQEDTLLQILESIYMMEDN